VTEVGAPDKELKVVKTKIKNFESEDPSTFSIFDRNLERDFETIYANVKANLPSTGKDTVLADEESDDEPAVIYTRERRPYLESSEGPTKKGQELSNGGIQSFGDVLRSYGVNPSDILGNSITPTIVAGPGTESRRRSIPTSKAERRAIGESPGK
ncbi:hypothetical protein FOL47_006154, partial [Perkinsus chesapeaki]